MRRLIFIIILALLAVGAAFFYVDQINAPSFFVKSDSADCSTAGWIEILSLPVVIKFENETVEQKIYNGDKLPAPATIVTGEGGGAIIHLANGSIIRLDALTEVEFKELSFNAYKKSLIVKLFLRSGRIWSKAIEIAGGNFYWEIKTGNAELASSAAAFGVEYAPGRTFLVVSEHKATLTAVDPENGKSLINSSVIIPPKKAIQIQDSDIENLKKGKTTLTFFVQDAPAAIWRQSWVERAISQDELINNRIEELKNGGLNDREIQDVLIKNNLQEMQDQLAKREN